MSITCVTFERTQSFATMMYFLEKTGSHRLVRCACEEGRQTFRDVGDFWRKQTAIGECIASFRRQAAMRPKLCIFEKRSEHPTHFWSFGSAHNECEDEESKLDRAQEELLCTPP